MYNTDLRVFDNPSEETKQFIEAISLFFECTGKLMVEPPLYKIYPNKLYRDMRKTFMVIVLIHNYYYI